MGLVVAPGLIAPKHVTEFTAEAYHEYVTGMFALRVQRGSARKVQPAPGLTVSRTKSGKLSVRRAKAQRAFDYVTMAEIAALAKALGTGQADVWNAFKAREFIIAKDRMEAERTYAELKELPW